MLMCDDRHHHHHQLRIFPNRSGYCCCCCYYNNRNKNKKKCQNEVCCVLVYNNQYIELNWKHNGHLGTNLLLLFLLFYLTREVSKREREKELKLEQNIWCIFSFNSGFLLFFLYSKFSVCVDGVLVIAHINCWHIDIIMETFMATNPL